jgi:hypothetical protein
MTPKTTKNNGRHVNGAQLERRVLRMTEREPRPPDLYRAKVAFLGFSTTYNCVEVA